MAEPHGPERSWGVLWNEKWRQLPRELNNGLSAAYHRNPAAVVQATRLFHQPGRYLFNLIKMTVTDVSHNVTLPLRLAEKELFDDFTADYPTLMAQGASEVPITVRDVRESFRIFQERDIPMQRFDALIAAKPLDEVVLSKVYVTRPVTIPRILLGNSYSDGLYGWVWDKLMGSSAVPTAAIPVQLKNVIFVNNPSLMQRFRAAVETLDVPNDWPKCPEASNLNDICSEHEFLFCLKTRVALMMHATDDYKERVILSCGFSPELNEDDTAAGIGRGIAFTCNPDFAKGILADRFNHVGAKVFERGKGCIILSWVAIGKPYFTQGPVPGRQAGCTTHFALTHNGGFATVNGATLDTPLLVSFEPELCCPFAVAEFDYVYTPIPTGA